VGTQENGTLSILNSYTTSALNGFSGLGSIVGVTSGSSASLVMTGCLGWSPTIKSTREDNTKWCCGGLVGSCEGKATASGCVRRADMAFTDAVRTLESHGNVSNATLGGSKNNRPYDGTPSTAATVSEAATAAGWSTAIWDLSADLPELKIFK
jgi:hypothetical protein